MAETVSFDLAYKRESFFSTQSCSTRTQSLHSSSHQKGQDLLPHPPKVFDLWGIEGEDTDLLLHQADFISPSDFLRAPFLGFLCANPRLCFHHLCKLIFVEQLCGFLGASNSVVEFGPKLCVKAPAAASRPPLSGRSDLGLCGEGHRRIS